MRLILRLAATVALTPVVACGPSADLEATPARVTASAASATPCPPLEELSVDHRGGADGSESAEQAALAHRPPGTTLTVLTETEGAVSWAAASATGETVALIDVADLGHDRWVTTYVGRC